MKAVVIAVALTAFASPSRAQSPQNEVMVVTGTRVDPAKLSDPGRLAHICQAAGVLKKRLQAEHDPDTNNGEIVSWILNLSCRAPKSN